MSTTEPDHILTILAVRDLARAVAFYRAAFGWTVEVEAPVYVEMRLPRGQRLGLYQREGFAVNTGVSPVEVPAQGISGTEIYLHVQDIGLAMERLEHAGARTLAERSEKPWGDEAAYYADPDGNVLVVARPLR